MDPNQITDFIQLAKSASPCGAGAFLAHGLFRLIRDLRHPRALAAAVKTMGTQEEKDALVELFRLSNPTKGGAPAKPKGKSRR